MRSVKWRIWFSFSLPLSLSTPHVHRGVFIRPCSRKRQLSFERKHLLYRVPNLQILVLSVPNFYMMCIQWSQVINVVVYQNPFTFWSLNSFKNHILYGETRMTKSHPWVNVGRLTAFLGPLSRGPVQLLYSPFFETSIPGDLKSLLQCHELSWLEISGVAIFYAWYITYQTFKL